MRVRGDRTCEDCGATWSYFETGDVACPECGSLHSTGRGERTQHTDRAVDLDLTDARRLVADEGLDAGLEAAAETALEYVRHRGFIDGGTLRGLDERYVFAQELRHAATLASTRLDLSDDERAYLLGLVDATAFERPPADTVPDRLRAARGLAAATAVRDYRDELRTWLETAEGGDAGATAMVESLGDHVKRVRALDGEVAPGEADALVAAARAVGRHCQDGDEGSLEAAESALDSLP